VIKTKHYEISREKLSFHEIIGLNMKIVKSKDPAKKGIKGKIVNETMKTFLIEKPAGEERTIPKQGNVFSFQLGEEFVEIKGERIMQNPIERLKANWRNTHA
jgi:ribonuclease P protein subunit POP4